MTKSALLEVIAEVEAHEAWTVRQLSLLADQRAVVVAQRTKLDQIVQRATNPDVTTARSIDTLNAHQRALEREISDMETHFRASLDAVREHLATARAVAAS